MEIKHFYTLPVGAKFLIDGEAFIKHSEVAFKGLADGLERYIDPIADAKIGKGLGLESAVPSAAPTVKLQGVVRDGSLIVSLKASDLSIYEGSAATVDGHFDGNVFVVTGISGQR